MKYKKGEEPWNKGKKGIHLNPTTEFKKGDGHTGKTHPSWKGGVQHNADDCVHLWAGTGKRIRRPRHIYEEKYGKIEKGLIIYHIDGDKNNDDIDNLNAISRAELLRLNNEKRRNC